MRIINNPIMAFIVLASFGLLAWYAYPAPASYSVSVFSVLDKRKPYPAGEVMALFHIRAGEIAAPVRIFGE